MMWWGGGWWVVGIVMMAIMVGCMWMMGRMMMGHGSDNQPRRGHDTAEQILAQRLANGEIDVHEYQARRDALRNNETSGT